jgi:hypothetical protein
MGGRGTPHSKRQRDKRYRENRKCDPIRSAKRRAITKKLKAKYRRAAGAESREQKLKRAAIRKLIKVLRRRASSLLRKRNPSKDQIEQRRQRINANKRRLYHADPKRAIYSRVKRSIYKHLSAGTQSRNWSRSLGYSMQELKTHIERQFTGRMSWRNKGKWHIDHIRPVASFSFTSIHDAAFRECYALSNLRPMWGRDNIIKSDKRTHLL